MKKLLLAGVVFALSMSAEAARVSYELHDVAFDDGATAYGSFDWSMEDGFANISITTTAGQKRSYGVTYTSQWVPGVIGVNFGVSLFSVAAGDIDRWDISFEPGGPVGGDFYLTSLASRPMVYQAYGESDAQYYYKRYVVSGYVAPVPVPAAFWLFGTSLAGLAVGKRRGLLNR